MYQQRVDIRKISKLLIIGALILLTMIGCADRQESAPPPAEAAPHEVAAHAEEARQTEDALHTEAPAEIKTIPGKIVEVIDGDTMKIELEGKVETVRLLLVDTPETKHPRHGVQPFGPEATQFAKEILPVDKQVEIEKDVSDRDKYGRLLAYLWVDGKMFNEMLLEKGLARVAYVYVPNVKYVDQFRQIQEQAQKAAVGIWSIEDYAREDGFHVEAVESVEAEQVINTAATANSQQKETVSPSGETGPNGETIKGNINSKGEKIYHVPGGQFYKQTIPEEWFFTEEEAEAAGFRKSKR